MPEPESGRDGALPRDRSPTLPELWRRAAARASDSWLAGLAGVGAVAAAAGCAVALGVAPGRLASWWPALLPAIAAGSFGLWGIAAREEAERRSSAGGSRGWLATLVALRWLAAVTASVTLGVALVLLLGVALGIVKS